MEAWTQTASALFQSFLHASCYESRCWRRLQKRQPCIKSYWWAIDKLLIYGLDRPQLIDPEMFHLLTAGEIHLKWRREVEVIAVIANRLKASRNSVNCGQFTTSATGWFKATHLHQLTRMCGERRLRHIWEFADSEHIIAPCGLCLVTSLKKKSAVT